MYDSGWIRQDGVSNGSYNLITGEVWATSIGDGKTNFPNGAAGFETSGIQNTGSSPWKGVIVTATIQVLSISLSGAPFTTGSYPVELSVYGNNISGYIPGWMPVYQPGLYTLRTQPFDMIPGVIYTGGSHISVLGQRNNGVSAYAKILSIKLNM